MLSFGLAVGFLSLYIYFLGLIGQLYYLYILLGAITFVLYCLNLLLQSRFNFSSLLSIFQKKLSVLLILFLFLLGIINLIGVFGPEIGFDALWYHLTLPKIFLAEHRIYYIPGNLLYYSVMPKLAEMLYIVGLTFFDERAAKAIHFLFGLGVLFVLYKLSRKYLSVELALATCLLFYSNLLVLWESSSSYIELIWTFFEVCMVWCFVHLVKSNEKRWFVWLGMMCGLAISTKLIALRSIFLLFCLYFLTTKKIMFSKTALSKYGLFASMAFLLPAPWFVFAFLTTGNPVYPLFSSQLSYVSEIMISSQLLNPVHFVKTFFNTFLFSADPISPLYLLFFPTIFITYKKMKQHEKILVWYCLGGFLLWYITSGVEGTRILLPYLPIFSLVTVISVGYMLKVTWIRNYRIIFLVLLLITSLGSLGYRIAANAKYIPYLLGKESKAEFLTKHLDFSFGDFYDIDGYFKKTITQKDRVLLYGFHNLYYIDFPFIHHSYVKVGDTFNYIAVQNGEIPEQYKGWKKIYTNPTTKVSLFTNSKKWETYSP